VYVYAVTTVMNLQLAGFSEKEIAELTALVGRWNKHWPGLGSPCMVAADEIRATTPTAHTGS
jgi:hypothetical protein